MNELTSGYLDLAGKIGLSQEAIEAVGEIKLSWERREVLKRLCYLDKRAFYKEVLAYEKPRLLFLYLYLQFARDLYADFKEQGLSDRVYLDTFHDITIWCDTCYRDYGEYGIEEYDWIYNHISMRLFRIGRLQYEKTLLWEDVVVDGVTYHKGMRILNVHIPEGSPLREEECRESLENAKKIFPDYQALFCNSWLLFPDLKEILPEASNILKFQQLFRLYQVKLEGQEARERIFGRKLEKVEDYPEDTTLQRAAKEYLLQGKRLGNGIAMVKN